MEVTLHQICLKPVILNSAVGKAGSNFDSNIRNKSKSFTISSIISNHFSSIICPRTNIQMPIIISFSL